MGLKALSILFAVSALLLMSTVSLCLAVPHVGVSVGDWVKYKDVRGGHGNTAWVGDFEFDDYIRVEVTNVTGDYVELLETHWPSMFSSGELYNSTSGVNVSEDGGEFKLTYAGLNVGDIVPASSWQVVNATFLISQQATRTYCGENRTVCMVDVNYSMLYYGDTLDISTEFWWDKETGILVETTFRTTLRDYGESSTSMAGFLAVETNLWEDHSSSSSPSPVTVLAASWGATLIAVTGILVGNKVRKRFKNGKS
jgi:hypothetical protein